MENKAIPSLNIPKKTLEDNFKLNDFQQDFTNLMELLLISTAQPKTINVIGSNRMEFIYDNGTTKVFQFEKRGVQISKITDLTNNTVTVINKM